VNRRTYFFKPWMMLCGVALGVSCTSQKKHTPEKSSAQPGLAAVRVSTQTIQIQPMPEYLTLTGSVLAEQQADVAANVSGQVVRTYVERGAAVKRGQTLALVDSQAAGYQAAAATAQWKASQTQETLAQQECQRADVLLAQGAVSQVEFDRLKAQCTAQLYQANAAQAHAELAGKLAGDTVIRSPINGYVGERYVNVGEYVGPQSRIASVYASDTVRVLVAVPESAVGLVRVGQTVDMEVVAWPGRVFTATVQYISSALRPNTRDLMVEATAENKDHALRPGMFAKVRLLVGYKDTPTAPLEALRTDGALKRMFLAKNGQVYEMVVRTGSTKEGRVAVLEQLSTSDQVIVNPPADLVDGSPIQ
jgi:membrane fusion protein (multidrug efflux system)